MMITPEWVCEYDDVEGPNYTPEGSEVIERCTADNRIHNADCGWRTVKQADSLSDEFYVYDADVTVTISKKVTVSVAVPKDLSSPGMHGVLREVAFDKAFGPELRNVPALEGATISSTQSFGRRGIASP